MRIGIISYFPEGENDSINRLNRIAAHKKQLDWLEEHFPNCPIFVAARGYHDIDYDPRCQYFTSRPGPGGARNKLLEEFYKSDDDFMLLMDDDSVVRDYYGGIELLKEIEQNPKKFIGQIDILNCVNPQFVGFKSGMLADRANVEENYTFANPTMKQFNFSVLSNFKKLHNEEIYFYEGHYDADRHHINIREDIIFFIDAVKKGLRVATSRDLILHTLISRSFTTCFELEKFDSDTNCKAHMEAELPTRIYLEENYGIDRNSKGGVSKYMKQFNPITSYKDFKIKREVPHVFVGRELDYKPRTKKES